MQKNEQGTEGYIYAGVECPRCGSQNTVYDVAHQYVPNLSKSYFDIIGGGDIRVQNFPKCLNCGYIIEQNNYNEDYNNKLKKIYLIVFICFIIAMILSAGALFFSLRP